MVKQAHGKCLILHRDEVPRGKPPIRSKPITDKSIIEVAMEYARKLKAGEVRNQSELARQVGVSHVRITQLLNLLKLTQAIQRYLVKTKDLDGRIRERQLRPLVSMTDPTTQIECFRRLLTLRLDGHS